MHHIFITYSTVVGYLGCFHFLGIINKAAVNMSEQASVGVLWDVAPFELKMMNTFEIYFNFFFLWELFIMVRGSLFRWVIYFLDYGFVFFLSCFSFSFLYILALKPLSNRQMTKLSPNLWACPSHHWSCFQLCKRLLVHEVPFVNCWP